MGEVWISSGTACSLQVIELYFTKHFILSYSNLGHTAKRHFKLYGDSISLLPLKLSYSRRASHQISTHVLRVLLEEVLGYEDVVLVAGDSGFSVNNALPKLAGCDNHRFIIICTVVMYISSHVGASKNGARN